MDLLLITDDSKSHYVYIKDFNRFMCHKTKKKKKKKNKKHFLRYCLHCFSSKTVLEKRRKSLFEDSWQAKCKFK